MFKNLSSRKFKMGAYGAVVTAVILVLAVAVNILAVLLTSRANAFIDLTASKAFQVTDTILEAFTEVKEPLEVTVLCDESDFASLNPYCAQVQFILSEAHRVNDKITVKYVDPVENPEAMTSYSQLDCTQYDIIMENVETGRQYELPFSDLFYISSGSITGSKAEAALASRMLSMTSATSFGVAFVTGHGDNYELEAFKELLTLNNYTVTNVSLVTESIPEDVLCVVIAGPSTDFAPEEIKKLEQFMLNSGNYEKSIMYFASMDSLELPNIEGFLANYGIAINDDIVIETNTNYVYGDNTSYALSGYMENEYSHYAQDAGLYSISPYTRPLEVLYKQSGDISVSELMCFSTTALAVNPLKPNEYRTSDEGLLYSALVSEQTNYVSGVGNKTSRLCVFGSVYFADDTFVSTESIGNGEYLIGVMSVLAPNSISLDVATKSILGGYMSITTSTANILGTVFIGIVPAIVIAAGIYVYIRRRNR